MAENEFEGQQVALALINAGTCEAVAAALVGCDFYLDDPDELQTILGARAMPGGVALVIDGRAPIPPDRLARGYILDTRDPSPLAPLLDAATPHHIKAADEARTALVKRGIHHPRVTHDDAVKLNDLLVAEEQHLMPPWELRREIADVFNRYDLHRAYIKLANGWIRAADKLKKPWPWDALIQMVRAHNELHEHESALTWTEVAVERGSGKRIPPGQLAILFNQRAATYLHLYQRSRNADQLTDARACANRSWAIKPSDECFKVYERLKRFENEHMDEQAVAARRDEEAQRKRYEQQRGWRPRKPPNSG